ncbi:MAG: hypothetical protein ACWGNO_11910 [Desulfobacterales bacterium]
MSQIVACRTDTGIILAADSNAFDVNPNREIFEVKINRMLQLTSNTAIVTGGAPEGEIMCRTLKDFISEENLTDIDEVYNAALPFLASEYEKFIRKKCAFLPIDPIHQVYFILGGYSQNKTPNPFQLYLLWTKMKLPQLDGDQISSAYTVPRLIRLEYKLNQLSKENKPLKDILPEIRSHLEEQAQIHNEISGPFFYAVIDRDGFKKIE